MKRLPRKEGGLKGTGAKWSLKSKNEKQKRPESGDQGSFIHTVENTIIIKRSKSW